ncbi:MAG: NAD-binding protein, partial [Bacteroidales bacterium]|nr:NAD-binding protein [Bacteroidales bacterium]
NGALMAGDLVYVIVRPESAEAFFALTGTHDKKINNVMIAGAGRIGKQTTLRIEKDMKVKLIEKDRRRCEEVAADVSSDTLIINGDATDLDVLRDEGMERMDAFIAVTDSTETNIMACLYAKKAGVHTTIALVENIDYIDLAQTVGVDTIINKKLITASYIARFTMNAEVESSKVLSGVDAEVLEFVVKPDAKVTRRAIKHLHLPEGSIIGGVIRGTQSFIAVGDFRIEAGDRVVVFAEPYAVRKLPGLFN